MTEIPFPRTSRPALSALAHAGYTHLGELDGIPMRAILDLHGMGPKGVGTLRRAMAEHGWAFADDDPRVGAVAGGGVSLTEGAQPERNDNTNLRVGERSAHEWVASLPKARQRDQGEAMLDPSGRSPASTRSCGVPRSSATANCTMSTSPAAKGTCPGWPSAHGRRH